MFNFCLGDGRVCTGSFPKLNRLASRERNYPGRTGSCSLRSLPYLLPSPLGCGNQCHSTVDITHTGCPDMTYARSPDATDMHSLCVTLAKSSPSHLATSRRTSNSVVCFVGNLAVSYRFSRFKGTKTGPSQNFRRKLFYFSVPRSGSMIRRGSHEADNKRTCQI